MTTAPAARSQLARSMRADRFFQLGLLLVGLMIIAALFAPWLAPHNPLLGDTRTAYLQSPGGRFLLGTDTQGRDVLSRVLYGARLSLSVGVDLAVGGHPARRRPGLLSGYYGRWVDSS